MNASVFEKRTESSSSSMIGADCRVASPMRATLARTTTRILFSVIAALCLTGAIGARGEEVVSPSANSGSCPTASAPIADPTITPHWNGWGVDPSQHRFQPGEMAQLGANDLPRLKLKWAFGFPFAERSVAQPTIFGGRVFIGSQNGKVYSLDAKSGCAYWEFGAGATVRSAIVVGQSASGWTAYFGDQRANVYAVDALTSKLLWKVRS